MFCMHQARIDWEWAVLCSWYVWLLLIEWVRKLGSMMFLFKSTIQIQCNWQSVISALRRFRITGAACFNHLQSITKQNMRLMVADWAHILVNSTFWRPVAARSSFRFHRLPLHPKHQFWRFAETKLVRQNTSEQLIFDIYITHGAESVWEVILISVANVVATEKKHVKDLRNQRHISQMLHVRFIYLHWAIL